MEADPNGPDKGYVTLSQAELVHCTGDATGPWLPSDIVGDEPALTGRGRIMLLNRSVIQQIQEQGLL